MKTSNRIAFCLSLLTLCCILLLERAAQNAWRDLASVSAEEYRLFQSVEQAELIDLLRGRFIYSENPNGLTGYWKNDLIWQTVIDDVRALVKKGVQLTVSADGHVVRTFDKPFNPELYCNDLGISPENTHTIVRVAGDPGARRVEKQGNTKLIELKK